MKGDHHQPTASAGIAPCDGFMPVNNGNAVRLLLLYAGCAARQIKTVAQMTMKDLIARITMLVSAA